MEFATTIGSAPLTFRATVDGLTEGVERLPQRLARLDIALDVHVASENDPVDLAFASADTGTVCPAGVDGVTDGASCSLSCLVPVDDPFTVRLFSRDATGRRTTDTLVVPPFWALRTARQLRMGDVETALGRLDERADDDDELYPALDAFLSRLDAWLSLEDRLQLLHDAAAAVPAVESALSTDQLASYVATQLARQEWDPDYEVESREQLEAVTRLTDRCAHLPTVSTTDALRRALVMIRDQESVSNLWALEQRCALTATAEDLLTDDEFAALFATAMLEDDRDRARAVVGRWIDPLEPAADAEARITAAKEAPPESRLDAWRAALPAAAAGSSDAFAFASANYLNQLAHPASDVTLAPHVTIVVQEAAAALYDDCGLDREARITRIYAHEKRGRHHRRNEAYESAIEAFEAALSTATAEAADPSFDFEGVDRLEYRLAEARALAAREADRPDDALDALAAARDRIADLPAEQLRDETSRQGYLDRLKAMRLEIEGDRALARNRYERAATRFQTARETYERLGLDARRRYLEIRGLMIDASLSEADGAYADAADTHREILSRSDDSEFNAFHAARRQICLAKADLVDLNLRSDTPVLDRPSDDGPASHLEQVPHHGGVAGLEADYLRLLLDVLDAYQRGETSDVDDVLSRLAELPDFESVRPAVGFGYGTEYRYGLVMLLAAQRLRQLDLDTRLLDSVVEATVRDVLVPDEATEVIEAHGFTEIRQWTQFLPEPFVRAFRDTERLADEANATDEYSHFVFGLIRILESVLEFVVVQQLRMAGVRAFDTDPELSLGSLLHAIGGTDGWDAEGTVFADRPWRDHLVETLDTEPLGSFTDATADAANEAELAWDIYTGVTQLRNQLGHDIARATAADYEETKALVESAFEALAVDVPVIAEVVDTHLGAYVLRVHWEHFRERYHIMTDADLDVGSYYVVPQRAVRTEPAETVPPEHVVEPRDWESLFDHLD